jgi:hypothetical protein
MTKSKKILPFIICAGIAFLLWTFAFRIQNSETVTFRAYGLEVKAEGRLPSQLKAQAGG